MLRLAFVAPPLCAARVPRAASAPFGAALARAYHHRAPRSPAENAQLLATLELKLRDPDARQRLSVLLSPSSARNLARAMNALPVGAADLAGAGAAAAVAAGKSSVSLTDLKFIALQQGLPFVGFGFVDNALMIIAGDYIDLTLGVSLGISSMAAAALGNTFSDVAGLGLGNVVEDMCARLGLPNPKLTTAQMLLPQTRFAKVAGSSIGVTIGCLLGMLPLLFLETREDHQQQPLESAKHEQEAGIDVSNVAMGA